MRSGDPQPPDGRYRRLVESLDDRAVFMLDVEGCVVSWGAGAETMKGYTGGEILGEHFSIFYSPEARLVGHPEAELSIARAVGRHEEQGWRVRNGERPSRPTR